MTVSFTGIKNVGYMACGSAEKGIYKKAFNFQVTNDEQGNDLDKFDKVLEKTGTVEKYQSDTPGLISLLISRTSKEDRSSEYKVVLNNNELELNDKNLPIFSFLSKTIDSIINKTKEELVLDDGVLEDNNIYDGTSLGLLAKERDEECTAEARQLLSKTMKKMSIDMSEEEKTELYQSIDLDHEPDLRELYIYEAYQPQIAIYGAERAGDAIFDILCNYFGATWTKA